VESTLDRAHEARAFHCQSHGLRPCPLVRPDCCVGAGRGRVNLLAAAATILLRIYWHRAPSPIPCAMFWVAALLLQMTLSGPFAWIAALGVCLNATATLSNGGRMPVGALTQDDGGIWIPLTSETRFPYLCDVICGHSSIGDAFLVCAFIGLIVTALA